MIKNILVLTSSGILLFNKEFIDPIPQPRLVGGILVSVISTSKRTLNRSASYLELENVALTLMKDQDAGLVCAVFHDTSDGYEFGKILASQILIRFLQEYGKNPSSFNPQLFESFQFKLPEIFRNMILPILDTLKNQKGIKHASLISSGNVLQSTNSDLGVSANLKILISHSTDLMHSALDHPKSIRMETDNIYLQIIQAEHLTYLIVVSQKNVDQKKVDTVVQNTAELISKVYILLSNTQNLH